MEKSFPVILSELRKERGLSQKDAAAGLGISQALLSHYEKGIITASPAIICSAGAPTARAAAGSRCSWRKASMTKKPAAALCSRLR